MGSSPEPYSAAEVARHYDELDPFYREIWGEHAHHGYWQTGRETVEQAVRAMVDVVMEQARIKPGMSVLDVGCGYGATANILAREGGAGVTGITLSTTQQRVAEALAGGAGNPRFLVEDWLGNQRPSETYDRVIAMESTEHMPDKGRVFAEMARVLKPGGRMVVVAWLAAEDLAGWQERHLIGPICRAGRLVEVATPFEYAGWIAAAGLWLEKETDISAHVSKTWLAWAWRFCLRALKRPRYALLALKAWRKGRLFGMTLPRIWLAYRTGAMRMVVFTASKSE